MGYINCTQSGMVKERFLVTGTRITKTKHWRKNTGGARHKQRVWVGQNYHPAADNTALGVPCEALLKVMRLKDRTTYITTLYSRAHWTCKGFNHLNAQIDFRQDSQTLKWDAHCIFCC